MYYYHLLFSFCFLLCRCVCDGVGVGVDLLMLKQVKASDIIVDQNLNQHWLCKTDAGVSIIGLFLSAGESENV